MSTLILIFILIYRVVVLYLCSITVDVCSVYYVGLHTSYWLCPPVSLGLSSLSLMKCDANLSREELLRVVGGLSMLGGDFHWRLGAIMKQWLTVIEATHPLPDTTQTKPITQSALLSKFCNSTLSNLILVKRQRLTMAWKFLRSIQNIFSRSK